MKFMTGDYRTCVKELLDGLNGLDGWSGHVRKMQQNWIGESKGASVRFELEMPDVSSLKAALVHARAHFVLTFATVLPARKPPLPRLLMSSRPVLTRFSVSVS